ncbi:LysM peptidoglycan-binding domain-containing protein [Planctomicrobium sp. SH661]|uniref:LysM peptidoglycan-binding domain-containing protein n=1 Tax=Planctomicrobium sp. SH661 TaxID=3448124 RepID=UPI003F5B6704
MRHDAKLGLALGMLVIGFAIAFCFPRQPMQMAYEKPEIPAPIADSTLNFLPIRAYQPTPADAAPAPATTSAESSTASASPLPELTIAGLPASAAPPTPIVPILIPPAVDASPADSDSPSPADSIAKSTRQSSPESESYRVKPGDTLSGIASRCLGSSARYQELFEANQDVLSSPNDLKIGMELKIPPLNGNKVPASDLAAKSKTGEQEPWNGLPLGPSKQFRPGNAPGGRGVQQPPAAPWVADRPQERQ